MMMCKFHSGDICWIDCQDLRRQARARRSRRPRLGQSAQNRLDIRAQNRKLNTENVLLMETVLQNKRSAEETAERHSQEKADLGRQLEAKDKELAECKAGHAAAVEKLESKHAAVVKGLESKHAAAVKELESKHAAAVKELESNHAAAVKEMKEQFAADKKERAEEATRKMQFDRGFYQQQLNVYDLDAKKKLENAKAETDVKIKKARLEEKSENNDWVVRAMIAEEQLAKLQKPTPKATSSGSKKAKP